MGAHVSTATCKGNLIRNHSLVAKILAPGITWFSACGRMYLCSPWFCRKAWPKGRRLRSVQRAQSDSWGEVRCPSTAAGCSAETLCCSPTASSGADVLVSPVLTATLTASQKKPNWPVRRQHLCLEERDPQQLQNIKVSFSTHNCGKSCSVHSSSKSSNEGYSFSNS